MLYYWLRGVDTVKVFCVCVAPNVTVVPPEAVISPPDVAILPSYLIYWVSAVGVPANSGSFGEA